MKTKILTIVLASLISCTMTFAQSATKSVKKKTATAKTVQPKDSVYYTCSMHHDVIMDKPGNCTKCEMKLNKKTIKSADTITENKEATKNYTCTGHTNVKADKHGKCPVCNMELTEKK